MTQKELLYVEDAIGHESNIISIVEDTISRVEDEELISFLNDELKEHKAMKKKLLDTLEKKSNEWSNTNG